MDSPGSPLSSIASDDISDREDAIPSSANTNMPPSKRRRTGIAPQDGNTTPISTTYQDQEDLQPPASPSTSISSDTSGEIPNSPTTLALLGNSQEEDYSGQGSDQVTVCRWEGCETGDLGNMDDLVGHIHNEHIGSRQKKYSCEWADCNRKGQTHASGYALRAHMRSHTREKPFYCSLPECDRSFTRSDALTKHTRTVHEAEALRPLEALKGTTSLPVIGGPTATPASKLQRIKLKLTQPPRDDASESAAEEHPPAVPTIDDDLGDIDIDLPEYGPEIGFDEHELSLPPRDLYRLLRRQIHWAEKEGENLRAEWERTIPKRKQSWLEKEGVFDDVIDAELRWFGTIVGVHEREGTSNDVTNELFPTPPREAERALKRYKFEKGLMPEEEARQLKETDYFYQPGQKFPVDY